MGLISARCFLPQPALGRKREEFLYYSLDGGIDAVRIGRYKTHFRTTTWMAGGSWPLVVSCHPDGIHVGAQHPPLVYDIENDIEENVPVQDHDILTSEPGRANNARMAACTLSSLYQPVCEASFAMNCVFKEHRQVQPIPPIPFVPWRQAPRVCCNGGFDVNIPNYQNFSHFTCQKRVNEEGKVCVSRKPPYKEGVCNPKKESEN